MRHPCHPLLPLLTVILLASSASAQVPTNGLIAHYPLDGDARDGSGNNRHGTPNNLAYIPDRFGRANSAAAFRNSFVSLPEINLTVNQLTFSFWVRFDTDIGPDANQIIQDRSPNHISIETTRVGEQRMTWTRWTSFSTNQEVLGLPVPRNVWTHYTCVFDPDRGFGAIYRNGVLESSGQITAGVTGRYSFVLGQDPIVLRQWLFGALDDFRIYNRALSAGEVAQLYASDAAPTNPQIFDGFLYYFNDEPRSPVPLNLNVWHYVAITKDSSGRAAIYVDGKLAREGPFRTNAYVWSRIDLAASFFTSYSYGFAGEIDEVRVSSTPRTPAEIQAAYDRNQPLPADASTLALYHFDEGSGSTLNGERGPTGRQLNAQWSQGRFGSALSFNGSNARAELPLAVPTGSMSIEFWVRPTSFLNATVVSLYGMYTTEFVLRVPNEPSILTQPASSSALGGTAVRLSVAASGAAPLRYQWLKNGAAVPGATEATLSFAAVAAADAGSYSVVVSNASGTVVSSPATLTVLPATLPPAITAQPTARAVVAGNSATLTVTASGTPAPAFQWLKDGAALPGATTASLTLSAASREQEGNYSVVVSNAAGTVVSSPATVSVVTGSALSNLSIRTPMAIGQTLIVGAVVSGGTKNVLVRAAGPALSAFGLAGMADPRLELFTGGTVPVTANDDWPASLASASQAVGAFGFNPGSRDAALQQSLGGSFTVQARGTGPGIVLVEAYDTVLSTSTRLVNLSARNLVGTGSDILIAGFAISGVGTKQLLIRAVGPGLAGFGVTGALPDPRLEVFDGTGRSLATNDNWGTPSGSASAATAAIFTQVGAFPLAAGSRDAALVLTLNAGASYTVQVAGVNNTTGEALIEVYEVF